jgi:hypothetical protein
MKLINKSGSALLLALLMITSILLFVLNISKFLLINIQVSDRLNDSITAEYAAKSGIDIFLSNKFDFLNDRLIQLNPNSGLPCDENKKNEPCTKISNVSEISSYSAPRTRAQPMQNNNPLEIHTGIINMSDQPCNNGALFYNLNQILEGSGVLSNLVKSIYNKPVTFVNPKSFSPDYVQTNTCADWQLNLESPYDLFRYDLIYISSTPNSELNLKKYFMPKSEGGISDLNLTHYISVGGHLYIENSYNSKIIFPTKEELSEWYGSDFVSSNGLDKLDIEWSAEDSDFYDNSNPDTYPKFINTSGIYNIKKNIFNYLYDYSDMKVSQGQTDMTIEKLISYLQDTTVKACPLGVICDYAKTFKYLLPEQSPSGSDGKLGKHEGYTELISYSERKHANMAIRYFGKGPWGWIIVSSSGTGGIVASPGDSLSTNYNMSIDQSDLSLTPAVLFFLGLGDYSQKIQTVKVVGIYGGNKKTYQLNSYLTLNYWQHRNFLTKRFKEVIE